MHVLQIVAVRCHTDAAKQAADLLEQAAESGAWFDWFEIGGRWGSLFRSEFPGHDADNVLSTPTHTPLVEQYLHTLRKRQNETFLTLRDSLLGTSVDVVEGAQGHILGVPVCDDPDAAERASKWNRDINSGWKAILAAPSLEEARKSDPTHLAAYQANRLIDLYHGEWTSDSGYYDLDNFSSSVTYALDDLNKSDMPVHLVAVDFHF